MDWYTLRTLVKLRRNCAPKWFSTCTSWYLRSMMLPEDPSDPSAPFGPVGPSGPSGPFGPVVCLSRLSRLSPHRSRATQESQGSRCSESPVCLGWQVCSECIRRDHLLPLLHRRLCRPWDLPVLKVPRLPSDRLLPTSLWIPHHPLDQWLPSSPWALRRPSGQWLPSPP